MISEFPTVNFIMAHFGVQTGGVYCFEPYQMAMDTARTSTASRAGACSRASSSSRRCCPSTRFSSAPTRRRTSRACGCACLEVLCHEPPQGLNLDEDTLEDYLGNNLARMIGIEPTPHPKTFEEAEQRLGRKVEPQPVIGLYRTTPEPWRSKHDHRHPPAPDEPRRRGLAPHRHAVQRRAHAQDDGRPLHDQRQAAPHRHGLHPAAAGQHRLSRRQPARAATAFATTWPTSPS